MKFTFFILLFFSFNVLISLEKNDRILASKIKFKTLESNEELCSGSVFTIQWEGVASSEVVTIEYSTNSGANWITITTNATGLSYNWTVPNTPSDNCVARVIAPYTSCSSNWMTRNLSVTHFRNGDSIPEVRDGSQWMSLTTPAWCYYNNDPATESTYGRLYNWYAVNDSRGLAPSGWHVATDDEWKTLEMCQDMTQSEANNNFWRGTNEGGEFKEAGTTNWRSPNTGANNESDMTILPSGIRNAGNGNFNYQGDLTYLWTSSSYNSNNAWMRHLRYDNQQIYRYYIDKKNGFPVRCVKD